MNHRQSKLQLESEIKAHCSPKIWDQLLRGAEINTRVGDRDFPSLKAAYNHIMDNAVFDDVWQGSEIVIAKPGTLLLYEQCKGNR